MATATHTTSRTLSNQCLGWTQGVSATIINAISPLTDTFARSTISRESRPSDKLKRTVTFHSSTNPVSLIYPQIDVSVSKPQLYRRKSSPPMPSGEHNAAARSRLRAKSERRSVRRRRQTMAAIYGSLSSTPRQSISGHFEDTECEDYQRPKPTTDTLADAKTKQTNPKNPLLRLKSSSTLDVAVEEMFEQFISFEKANTHQPPLFRRRGKPILDSLLISPKTVFPNPSSGLVTDNRVIAFTNSIAVSRKKKDRSAPPVSSSYYLWHLFIDGEGPTLFAAVDGRRGSGWTIDTPTLGKGHRRGLDSVDGVYHPGIHGKRRYNRESGFWAWE